MDKRELREVQVLEPITIAAIEWKRDSEDQWVATRANLEYRFSHDGGAADPTFLKARGLEGDHRIVVSQGGPVVLDIGADSELALRDEAILERFLCLGVSPELATKIDELCKDPAENDPVRLETGTLAELLSYGIGPVEVWSFLLNHGAARRRSVANASTPDEVQVRTYDPWASTKSKRKRLEDAARACGQAARALRKVQSLDMSAALVAAGQVGSIELQDPRDPDFKIELRRISPTDGGAIGPQPALLPKATEALITDLEAVAERLNNYLSVFRIPAYRPPHFDAARFCRDWYALAVERSGGPLYQVGAALYSLVFTETSADSFERLCRRARRTRLGASE
jgi:hypothetical protein